MHFAATENGLFFEAEDDRHMQAGREVVSMAGAFGDGSLTIEERNGINKEL